MSELDKLITVLEEAVNGVINWEYVKATVMSDFADTLAKTPQNPKWHGEGDVWTHTKMVCEELIKLEEYSHLEPRQRAVVFLSALLHDVGKGVCTKIEDGVPTSPNHGIVGSKMARVMLVEKYGFCGSFDAVSFREAVCLLIRYHSFPVYFFEKEEPERAIRSIASNSELTSDFNIKHLCILSKADVLGRIGEDNRYSVSAVDMCRDFAIECSCYESQYPFKDLHTAYRYYCGAVVQPYGELYDESWGEIILMSGLPGTGKDTWIMENCKDMPMISLDDIRIKLGVKPTEDQTEVVIHAKERAKELLRSKTAFVWNATCLTSQLRSTAISLFESYGARVRIVYLETDKETRRKRNTSRKAEVPEGVVSLMLKKMNPPERFEAQSVQWIQI